MNTASQLPACTKKMRVHNKGFLGAKTMCMSYGSSAVTPRSSHRKMQSGKTMTVYSNTEDMVISDADTPT